jgi:cytochrome c oxidase assembly factor CtaG
MDSLLYSLLLDWPWRPLTSLLLLSFTSVYIWGWIHSRRAYPKLATIPRLLSFVLGIGAVALAMLSPLYVIRQELLAARAAEQILLGIVAPPLLWLACPFHIVVWGMPPTAPAAQVADRTPQPFLDQTSGGLVWHTEHFSVVARPGDCHLAAAE